MSISKSTTTYFIVIGLTALLAFFTDLFFSEQQDFLTSEKKLNYSAYNDNSSEGNSIANLVIGSGKQLVLTYELKPGFEYPYAGVAIEPSLKEHTFNFEAMNELLVEVKASHGTKIPISLMVFDKRYSIKEKPSTYLTFEHTINAIPNTRLYRILLSEFSIPEWWYKEHKVEQVINFAPEQHQVNSINIENCALINTGVKDTISITSLKLQNKSHWHLFVLITGWLILLVLVFRKWANKKKTLLIQYAASELNDEAKKKISPMDYIAKNYQNPELSLSEIRQQIGVSESKISDEIKTKTNLSFKQYLNAIRLEEAKNLLNNSNLSISEIAYQVGYNNVSHFNRVFKQIEDCSPGSFRKNEKS